MTEARAAAREIDQHLRAVQILVQDVLKLPSDPTAFLIEDRRLELQRLIKLSPAINSVRLIDADGKESLFISRIDRDRIAQSTDRASTMRWGPGDRVRISYSAVFYKKANTPTMLMTFRGDDDQASSSSEMAVELNLKVIAQFVETLHVGEHGRAYIVDSTDHLISHAEPRSDSSISDLSRYEPVVAVRDALRKGNQTVLPTLWAESAAKERVLTSAFYIPAPNWLVFVEQPASEVLANLWATIRRFLILLGVAIGLACIAGILLARRLTQPLLILESGALQIGRGALNTRIRLETGNELETLASSLNTMATTLQDSYLTLESKVKERTRELAESQGQVERQAAKLHLLNDELNLRLNELSGKKEEADRASAAKTRFLAAASHDLRQPMHTVSLLTGILRERMTSTDDFPLVDKIGIAVDSMEQLFRSLLDISQLDSGTVKPHLSDFPLNELLSRIESAFGPQAIAAGVQLRVRGTRMTARSDFALLERILANLVSNAIRYAPQGRILLGCRRRGTRVLVIVVDTGIGISSDKLDEVFEEFFQIPRAWGHEKGLGLGLSIVKRSAELLGHELSVRSRVDHGSTFGIYIPTAAGVPDIRGSYQKPSLQSPTLKGLFVVIVDDDVDNLLAMARLFRQWECHLITGISEVVARDELKNHLRVPDLIICDYRLRGGETGTQVIANLRRHSEQIIPAILVSGDPSIPADELATLPRIAVLQKPVGAHQLMSAAEAIVASQG